MFPQDDVRKVHGFFDIPADSETPQHPAGVDEVGGGRDPARCAVGSDDGVGTNLGSARERETLEPSVTPEGIGGTVDERFGARIDRGLAQRGVKVDAAQCETVPRIRAAGVARESDPT